MNGEPLQLWCDALIERGLATAVECRLSSGDGPLARAAAGDAASAGEDPPPLFDLASLTKPLTATLALVLDAAGRLPLASRVGDVWPEAAPEIARSTLEDLLRHRTGLRRWMPLYATCRDERELAARLLGGEWLRDGDEVVYSDLDVMLWTLTAERALDDTYWRLLRRHVLARLGDADFAATGRAGARALACRLTTGREVELARAEGLDVDELAAPARGEAQDGNCRHLGRPFGHAGVFATAAGMERLAREWLRPRGLLTETMVARALDGDDRFALGWYRRGETAASRGLGAGAFGHDGFTGGTVWVDPGAGRLCVCLCHRAALATDLSAARTELTRIMIDTPAA